MIELANSLFIAEIAKNLSESRNCKGCEHFPFNYIT